MSTIESRRPGGYRLVWLTPERLAVYPRLFVLVYAILIGFGLLQSQGGVMPGGKPIGYDFIAFWSASWLALAGTPLDAYSTALVAALQAQTLPGLSSTAEWIYPPLFLLMVLPLALLPYLPSYLLFMASTLAAYGAVLRTSAPAGLGLIWLFAFPGIVINALQGQNGFLTATLIGVGLHVLPTRPMLAGVAFGLLTVKPHLGLLLPLALIATRQWRALAAAAITTLMLVALSIGAFGIEAWMAFLEQLPKVAARVGSDPELYRKAPTLFVMARSAGLPVPLAHGLHATVAVLVVWLAIGVWRRGSEPAIRNATLTLGSLLMSPYLLDYDLAWLALPMVGLTASAQAGGWRRGDPQWLMLAWLMPLLPSLTYGLTGVQLAPLGLLGLFLWLVRRSRETRADGLLPSRQVSA